LVISDADDVAEGVNYASRTGLRVAVHGTDHGAAALGAPDDTVLINTHKLQEVTVDSAKRARPRRRRRDLGGRLKPATALGLWLFEPPTRSTRTGFSSLGSSRSSTTSSVSPGPRLDPVAGSPVEPVQAFVREPVPSSVTSSYVGTVCSFPGPDGTRDSTASGGPIG
jgi:hypothetical protein